MNKEKKISKELANYVKEIRGERSITQMAKEVGRHKSFWSRLEKGIIPSINILGRICDILQLDPLKKGILFSIAKPEFEFDIITRYESLKSISNIQKSVAQFYYMYDQMDSMEISVIPAEFQTSEYLRESIFCLHECYGMKCNNQDMESCLKERKKRQEKFFSSNILSRFIVSDSLFHSVYSDDKRVKNIMQKQIYDLIKMIEKHLYCKVRILKNYIFPPTQNFRIIGNEFVSLTGLLFNKTFVRKLKPDLYEDYRKNYEFYWSKALSEDKTIEELKIYLKKSYKKRNVEKM